MKSRKEVIKETAALLFRQRGYSATSMRDIAKEVGIKAASIYNHIESKQHLLSELLLDMAILFTEGMEAINSSSLNATLKLENLIKLHVRLTVEHTDSIALIVGDWIHLEEPARAQFIDLRNNYEEEFKNIIESGKKGNLIDDIDTEIILFSTLSTLRWLYSWYIKNDEYNIEELESHMTQCLLNGIKKK